MITPASEAVPAPVASSHSAVPTLDHAAASALVSMACQPLTAPASSQTASPSASTTAAVNEARLPRKRKPSSPPIITGTTMLTTIALLVTVLIVAVRDPTTHLSVHRAHAHPTSPDQLTSAPAEEHNTRFHQIAEADVLQHLPAMTPHEAVSAINTLNECFRSFQVAGDLGTCGSLQHMMDEAQQTCIDHHDVPGISLSNCGTVAVSITASHLYSSLTGSMTALAKRCSDTDADGRVVINMTKATCGSAVEHSGLEEADFRSLLEAVVSSGAAHWQANDGSVGGSESQV